MIIDTIPRDQFNSYLCKAGSLAISKPSLRNGFSVAKLKGRLPIFIVATSAMGAARLVEGHLSAGASFTHVSCQRLTGYSSRYQRSSLERIQAHKP